MTSMKMLKMPKAGYAVLAETKPVRGTRVRYQFVLWSKLSKSTLEFAGAAPPAKYDSELIEEHLGVLLVRDPLTVSFVGKQKATSIFKWLLSPKGKDWLTMYAAEIDVNSIRMQKVEFSPTEAWYRTGFLRRQKNES